MVRPMDWQNMFQGPDIAGVLERKRRGEQKDLVFEKEMKLLDLELEEAQDKRELEDFGDFYLTQVQPGLEEYQQARNPEALTGSIQALQERVQALTDEGRDPQHTKAIMDMMNSSLQGQQGPDPDRAVMLGLETGDRALEEMYNKGLRTRPKEKAIEEQYALSELTEGGKSKYAEGTPDFFERVMELKRTQGAKTPATLKEGWNKAGEYGTYPEAEILRSIPEFNPAIISQKLQEIKDFERDKRQSLIDKGAIREVI